MLRFPVVYKNKPLTPMKLQKCKRLVNEGRAKWCFCNKLKIRYIKINFKPSGFKIPKIQMGWDIGSHFCGISVVSPMYHHLNCEIVHNREVKELIRRRSVYRKLRRSRLRHRPSRFLYRTKSKIAHSVRTLYEHRVNLFNKIIKLYPITNVNLEKVTYNPASKRCKNPGNFLFVMQGQARFISYLRAFCKVTIVQGYYTQHKRIMLFGYDPKIAQKHKLNFNAHCVDSFALACMGIIPTIKRLEYFNKTFRVLSPTKFVRRYFNQFKKKYGKFKKNRHEPDCFTPFYFRWKKGNIREIFKKYSKIKKLRIKPASSNNVYPHSNHCKNWVIKYTKSEECFKKFKQPYGGTCKNGISRYKDINGFFQRVKLQIL